MFKLPTNWQSFDHRTLVDRLFVLIGLVGLLIILVGTFLPRNCPFIRDHVFGCPKLGGSVILTPEQQELARYPHQSITTSQMVFDTKSQNYRQETEVRFSYRLGDSQQYGYLQLKEADTLNNIALITHPLLVSLDWPSISTPTYRLYHRHPTFASIADFQANLPPANQLVADSAAAQLFGLRSGQYQLIDPLTSLQGVNYVLTTYAPPQADHTWSLYDYRFNAQTADVDSKGNLHWALFFPNLTSKSQPFLLSTVHIDYTQAKE